MTVANSRTGAPILSVDYTYEAGLAQSGPVYSLGHSISASNIFNRVLGRSYLCVSATLASFAVTAPDVVAS